MSPVFPPNDLERSDEAYQYTVVSPNLDRSENPENEYQYYATGALIDRPATPSAPPQAEVAIDEGFYTIPGSSATNPYQELNVKSNNFGGLQKVKRESQPIELQEAPTTPKTKAKKPPPVMQKPPRNFKVLSRIPSSVDKDTNEEKFSSNNQSSVDGAVNDETYDLVGTITRTAVELNNPTYDPKDPSTNPERLEMANNEETYDVIGTISRSTTDMDNPTYEASLGDNRASNATAHGAVNDDENQRSVYVNQAAIRRMASIRSQTITEDGDIGGEYADPVSFGFGVDAGEHPYVNTRIGSQSGSFKIEEKDMHSGISRKATLPI